MTWYLPEDLAKICGVTPRTIKRWANERRIPHMRVGRAYRFTHEQLKQIEDAYGVEQVAQVDVKAPNPEYEPSIVVVPMIPRKSA